MSFHVGMILAMRLRLNSNSWPFFSSWDFRNTLPDHPSPFSISLSIIFLVAHLRHALRHILTSGLPLKGKDFIFPQFQVSSPSPSTSLAQLRDVAKETPRSLWLSYQLSTASPCTEQNTKMSFLFTLPYCKADPQGTNEGSWRNSLGLATVISPALFPG